MSASAASWGSSMSRHLRATKKILQGVAFDARMTLDPTEFDVLEQDAFEVLRLIRSWRNSVIPINRIPPEILTLLPDFWDTEEDRDQWVIVLTHVCRAWREAFISRPSLWADLYCEDVDKTRVYLERSKSSAINVSLCREDGLTLCDPFLQVIPHITRRLKSLFVEGAPCNLEDITARLSLPAPLLQDVSIDARCGIGSEDNPILPSTLFNGDLSSLRKLCLQSVRTELPWKNMANLTSFELSLTSPVSIEKLLNFFERAPHLRKVKLLSVTLTPGAQDRRPMSLACLKRMDIDANPPLSLLLDHLLIPIGARFTARADLVASPIEDLLPRSRDNLMNFPDFTIIRLCVGHNLRMEFSGPNGQVTLIPVTSRVNNTLLVFESLAQLDTSKAEHLKIDHGASPSYVCSDRALRPMTNLRTLTLALWENTRIFIWALSPQIIASKPMVCPKLEELVLDIRNDGEMLLLSDVIEMAEARASKGSKLKSVKILTWHGLAYAQGDVLELQKHVSHLECWTCQRRE